MGRHIDQASDLVSRVVSPCRTSCLPVSTSQEEACTVVVELHGSFSGSSVSFVVKSDETVRGKDVRHRWWGRSDSWSSLESPGWITDGGAGDFVDSAAVRNGSFLRVFHGCVGFFLLGWAGLLSHSRGSRHPPTRMGQPADSPRHEVVVVCLGSL